MPKINRVRIVNFSYNNNNRHIIDECFDFYGGENALLSLANGGGKSVLVQVMLQPVLPKVTMLGRKFGDFFTAKKTPAYIMTEWKLDDEAGYLLTGIAVTSRASHSTNEEEENTDIRYFSFLSFYEKANAFDIKYIPVTEQVGSSVRIASYNEFRKLLEKESGRNQSELHVYDSSREEQSQYDRKLNSYGISREEWKELIVKINEAEHGVSEVFSECKTSRKVMEQWVIKYIEKVLNKSSDSDSDATDHKKLEIMMAQVAQSLVDNENHIREYKAIEGFNRELENINNDAKVVLSQLDNEDRLRKDIAGGYQILKREEQRLGQELIDVENRLKELDDQLELIAIEEKSQEIYRFTEEVEIVDAKLAELVELGNSRKENLDEKKNKLVLQKAAERYGKIQEKEKAIAQLQQRLDNASKDQEALLKNLNRIKYSLKNAYCTQLPGINKEIDGADIILKGVSDGIESSRSGAAECQTQINKLNIDIGGVGREISNFEKEEPGLLESIKVQLFRNPLLKELDRQDILKVETQLSKEYQGTEVLLNERRIDGDKLKETLNELRQRREELSGRHTELKVAESEIAVRIKGWENEKQKVIEALKRLNISADYLFDPVYLIKATKEYLNDWENKAHHLKMEISETEKQIHGIEKGVSYLPASLIALLENHNLPCYTGEKYLREINEEDKQSLMVNNPLLPYALIATEKEIALLQQLTSHMEFSQIVPVIHYNQRDQRIDPRHGNIQFIASSQNIALDNGDIGIFIQRLMDKKDAQILELGKAAQVIDRINGDYQTIAGFRWSEQQVGELEQERRSNEKEINKNHKDMEACMLQIDDGNLQQEKLTVQIDTLKNELSVVQDRIKGFKNYLAKNSVYMENVHLHNEIQSKIKSLFISIRKYEDEKARLEGEANELREALRNKRNSKKDIEDKLSALADAAEDELIDGSIPELEGRLEAYGKQQNNVVADLSEQIKGLKMDIQGVEKDIRKLKLISEEYKNIVYSESVEIELEVLCSKLETEIEGLKKDESGYLMKRSRLSERIEMVNKALDGKPAVPVENIKGNFSKRREEANRESIENKARNKMIHEDKLELARLIMGIETEIKEIRYLTAENMQKSFMEVKGSIGSMLAEYGSSRRKSNESIQNFSKISSQFVNSYSKNEEGTVKEAVKGLQSQIDSLDRSYDKYYYLSERMEYYFAQLFQILKIMESKMLQLEHSRNDLTEHAFMEARRIYHEIPKISENSAVEIEGVRKRVLEIQYEEMENELQAKEKMGMYIQECLQSLIKLIKENEDENRLRRDIEKYMSTKELLNIISRLENCKIRAYKVDLNEKNRRMMPWEDIIIKNSGGEKFVAYFSLLVALISYSRKQMKGYEAFKRKEESKVLIMDNPFGPITSGHLLKPMFDIAKKYNTQLICLSDIKQGSVVNSFDLIYMIKIRQNMMQEDFLELEPVILKELKQDEKLENAHLYGKIQQVSLFD